MKNKIELIKEYCSTRCNISDTEVCQKLKCPLYEAVNQEKKEQQKEQECRNCWVMELLTEQHQEDVL